MKNQRVCFIDIDTPSGSKRLDGLAIRFNIQRKMGVIQSEAKFTIYNLNREDLDYLTTFTSPYIDPKKSRRIALTAGYEDTGAAQLFFGDITRAIPKGMPDTALEIEAKTNYSNNQKIITYQSNVISSRALAQDIAKEFKLPLQWEATTDKQISGVSYTGSKTGLIEKLNENGDIYAFEDNGTIKVVDRFAQKKKGQVKLVSKSTGMIGIPEPDQYGVKVKTLLDPTLFCGDWFELKSERLPASNGYYQIYSIDFVGASREADFYAIIGGKNQRKTN